MLASDAITEERIALATPGGASNTRWSDTQLLVLTSRAVKNLVGEIYFPESRLTTATVTNQQEYQLPEMHAIYRVYMNGQLCVEVPGNITTLEGGQILYDDQTGSGAQTSGSGGPPGTTGNETPLWNVLTPVSYPFLNNYGYPAPNSQPSLIGQRPRFYRRGGYIGLVPAPGASGTLVVEGIRVPTAITSASQTITVPDNFMDAIVNYVVYRAFLADKDQISVQVSQSAFARYQDNIRDLRTWKRQYSLDDDQFMPITQRSAYRIGGHRSGGGNW
jgi:uncharacterized protein DUF6682